MQSERPPYENPPTAWPEIGAALLVVLKATRHVLRELLKLAWRVSAILVPVVLGALANMVLSHFRGAPVDADTTDDPTGNSALWRPCDGPSDTTHSDWETLYGEK